MTLAGAGRAAAHPGQKPSTWMLTDHGNGGFIPVAPLYLYVAVESRFASDRGSLSGRSARN